MGTEESVAVFLDDEEKISVLMLHALSIVEIVRTGMTLASWAFAGINFVASEIIKISYVTFGRCFLSQQNNIDATNMC